MPSNEPAGPQLEQRRVLALHGFTGRGADFAAFAPLCGGGWHCPDLPGHGPAPELDCGPTATLRWLEAQYSAPGLQAGSASILLGYSMGARAALLHACRYPDRWRGLILISPNPGIECDEARSKRRAVDAKLAQRIESEGVPAFIEFWQNTPMIRSQKNIRQDWHDAMQAGRTQHTAQGLATSLRQFGQGSCPDLWPELGELPLPTLLLSGSEDHKYTELAARMAKALPDAIHHSIDDAGHMPHLEAPQSCAAKIREFLQAL